MSRFRIFMFIFSAQVPYQVYPVLSKYKLFISQALLKPLAIMLAAVVRDGLVFDMQ